LDEAFNNIDVLLKENLFQLIEDLIATYDVTLVTVTHDHGEATRLSSNVAIMRDGHIEQVGTIEKLRKKPANDFVKRFFSDQVRTRIK